ncbi:hypothetical protein ABPG74_019090 [Tetrahymena malaccensis]
MSKLLAEIAIIAITVSSVFAQPALIGAPVLCGTATDCVTCGINSTVQNLFQIQNSPYCIVKSCSDDPGTNLNGWMCSSCESSNGFQAYGSGKIYFDPITSSCIASCSPGYHADSYNNCSPNGGASVGCGTASSAGGACVASCTGGQVSDATNTCNAVISTSIAGKDVGCGTAGNAGGNSSNCNGCGASNTIQGLFTASGTPNCKLTDCSANPGSNLNGWMCKSCNGVAGAHSAYSAGNLFSGTTCVASCQPGQTADANNVCVSGTDSTNSSGSSFLTFAFVMLLLCLLL